MFPTYQSTLYCQVPMAPQQAQLEDEFPQYSCLNFNDPAEFDAYAFPTHFQELGHKVPCKVLICVTIYNEDSFELQETLKAICKNAEKMQDAGIVSEAVGVVIIQDGLEKLHEKMAEFGKSMNLFNIDEIQRDAPPNSLHCFAAELQYAKSPTEFYPKISVITGIKQSNKGKLNSHRWFFKCMCQHVNPKYCVLIDCGTIPQDDAIYWLVDEMENYDNVGGVCGEIRVLDPKYCYFIETAQDIEYRVSHIMDKSLESLFGFVTVLPGAFSGYRWKYLNGEPLDEHYFYAIRPDAKVNCFFANMFLAEDRVLGAALLLRAFHGVILSFVEKSIAYTDCPRTFATIMQQRRRWINGSWFALLFTFRMFLGLKDTSHGTLRKLGLIVFMTYNFVNTFIAYFAPAIFYMYIHIIFETTFGENKDVEGAAVTFKVVYGLVVFLNIVTSLGNKPTSYPNLYIFCASMLGLIILFALGLTVFQMYNGEITAIVIFFVLGLVACLLFCAWIHGQFKPLARGILQYVFMIPCYINVYLIYAFCNIDDVTWGLRNDKESHNVANIDNKKEEFRVFRTKFISAWILLNIAFIGFFTAIQDTGEYYIVVMTFTTSGLIIIKTMGSILYEVKMWTRKWFRSCASCCGGKTSDTIDQESNPQSEANPTVSQNVNSQPPASVYNLPVNSQVVSYQPRSFNSAQA